MTPYRIQVLKPLRASSEAGVARTDEWMGDRDRSEGTRKDRSNGKRLYDMSIN